MSDTVVINYCDTAVTNDLLEDGCTVADLLQECYAVEVAAPGGGGPPTNKEERACVRTTAFDLLKMGVLDRAEVRYIMRCSRY